MFRKSVFTLSAALPLVLLRLAGAADPLPPAAEWLPPEPIVSIEVSDPNRLLDRLLDPHTTAAIQETAAYQHYRKTPQMMEFLNGIRLFEASLGVSWETALRKLVGGGAMVAVWPNGDAVAIIDGEDADLLGRLHEMALAIAQGEAEKAGQPGRVASADYRGVTGWTFNGEEAHAILGTRFVLANRAEALRAVIDLKAEGSANLASTAHYRAAAEAAGSSPVMGYVDLATLRHLTALHNALEGTSEPLASLLFSGILESIRTSNWLALTADLHESLLYVAAVTDGEPVEEAAAFALPKSPGEGAMPNLDVPGRIAALSLYRDLHGFYAAKDDLFPERTSGLIFFENMMGIFFSGRDFTEEVLVELKPQVRLVVAEQVYDPAVGTPRVQVPAFALVFGMHRPESFMPVAEGAVQTALGLVNFTRGQQGLAGLIIDRLEHGDTRFTVAYFSTVDAKDPGDLDTQFNFRPALARVGEFLVLSSTEGLARDLIDVLTAEAAEAVEPLPGVHSLMEADATALASIARANFDQLVLNNMVEQGTSREESEAGITGLITILEHLGRARLEMGSQDGQTRLMLDIEPNLP